MASKATYVVPYRRKRQKKTDYHKRLDLLKSRKGRVVIRPSNKHICVQVIRYNADGDRVIASAHSSELKDFGWKFNTGNTPAAYLTGLLCGKRTLKEGVKEGVLDLGLYGPIKGSRIYGAFKGLIDSGLDVPHDDTIFPDESRVKGEHIENFIKVKITKNFDDARGGIIKGDVKVKKKAAKPEEKPKKEVKAGAEKEVKVKAKAKPRTKKEVKPEAAPKTKAKPMTKKEVKPEAAPKTKAKPRTKKEVKPEAAPKTKAKPRTKKSK